MFSRDCFGFLSYPGAFLSGSSICCAIRRAYTYPATPHPPELLLSRFRRNIAQMDREKIKKNKGLVSAGILALASVFASVSNAQAQETKYDADPVQDRITEEIITIPDGPGIVAGDTKSLEPLDPRSLSNIYRNSNPQEGESGFRLNESERQQVLRSYSTDQPWRSFRYSSAQDTHAPLSAESCDIKDRLSGNLINLATGRNFRLGIAPDSDELLKFEIRFGHDNQRDLFAEENECLTTNKFGLSGALFEGFEIGRGLLNGAELDFD